MGADGAHLGADASQALSAVLGDDDEREAINRGERERTPEQMREDIFEGADAHSYGGAANALAAVLIRVMDEQPEARQWPGQDEGDWRHEDDETFCDSFIDCDRQHDYVRRGEPNLTDAFKQWVADNRDDPLAAVGDEALRGATGFMWGWAVNAAKYVHSQPPEPNPAIMTIGR